MDVCSTPAANLCTHNAAGSCHVPVVQYIPYLLPSTQYITVVPHDSSRKQTDHIICPNHSLIKLSLLFEFHCLELLQADYKKQPNAILSVH